jgi:hypothetical protein
MGRSKDIVARFLFGKIQGRILSRNQIERSAMGTYLIVLVALEVLVEWILWPLDLGVFIVVFVEVGKRVEVGG